MSKKSKGQELLQAWEDNEETMGEMAAYHVACEQLDIDPDTGWEMLAELDDGVSYETE